MKVLQINTTYGLGSTGRIVSGIDNILQEKGIESYVGYGYGNLVDDHHYKIINQIDSYIHNALSRLFDGQGLMSTMKTKRFVKWVDHVSPDVIHLHNLHGNFFNYEVLFDYLMKTNCKVIWTLHDCWTFTGHCAYFDMAGCEKWKTQCDHCPQTKCYPPSFLDRSKRNYNLKKRLFTGLGDRLVLIPVSNWLEGLLKESFFCNTRVQTIHNGINLSNFVPCPTGKGNKYVLGVAGVWDERKGMKDFIKLRGLLDKSVDIMLVGLTKKQIQSLPDGIKGISRTNSLAELAQLYSDALVTVNPTYEDNYPTVNLESIACGTPVITYRTGGSPESVDERCGVVVNKGDIQSVKTVIDNIIKQECHLYDSNTLRQYAISHFDEASCFLNYIDLYHYLL